MSRFERLTEAIGAVDPQPRAARLAAQRARVVASAASLASKPREQRNARWLWLAAAVAAAAVVFTLAPWRAAPRAPSTPTLRWEASAERDVRFVGDLGFVEVAPGTTAEVDRRERSVEAVLAKGSLSSKVRPGLGTRWTVRAGEYRAEAVGTEFVVERDPARFHVTVQEGTVRVTGGRASAEGILLFAGDALTASATELEVRRAADEPSSTASALVAPSPPVVASPPETARKPPPGVPSAAASAVEATAGEGWSELSARGLHGQALAAAVAQGFDGLVETLPCPALSNLAESARLAPDPTRAERALRKLRERCSGTPQAARALFLLGRLVDSRDARGAAELYAAYLSEAPGGSFAEQALGRRVSALQRAGLAAEANAAAKTYLARYPNGSYARLAESVVAP